MSQDESPFSIRPATLDDLPRLIEIESRIQAVPWSRENFEGEFQKEYSQTWLLTDDETDSKIAGYVVFWNLMGECQILNIGVDREYRGLGYAKKLLRSAINEAIRVGSKKALLHVRVGNLAAIQLYQSVHFLVTLKRKAFYSNGEDAYQMELELDGSSVIRLE